MGGYQGIVSGMVAGRHCVQVHFRSIAHCQGLCFGGAGWSGTVRNGGGWCAGAEPCDCLWSVGRISTKGHERVEKGRDGPIAVGWPQIRVAPAGYRPTLVNYEEIHEGARRGTKGGEG